MMKPFSLYVHIPFCVKKCNYCDFLSFTSDDITIKRYIESLCREIKAYQGVMNQNIVSTIFFGGGTPSLIKASYIEEIIKNIESTFEIRENTEISIEINPGTVAKEHLKTYKKIGINRISIGCQSFDDEQLKLLGRIHNYHDFSLLYNNARIEGFDNINIDLMMGLPNQTLENWDSTLKRVVELQPEHISCYSLSIEEGTPFYSWYKNKKINLPNEDIDREMYSNTINYLKSYGYKHYEISNFAKKGYECRHNLTYWTLNNYLGIGLGASSCLNNTRFKNSNDMDEYVNNSENVNKIREQITILSSKQQIEEFMFLGLRLIDGVSKKEFHNRFKMNIEVLYNDILCHLEQKELIKLDKDIIKLTNKGLDISNYIYEQFLLD